ncbi:hypothetical protein [Rosenbergiella australiborealis]|uniref:hypothetical protein n=1 Tax=Rosenbergiella australiborealis TaxID=1544696 RepID=UPI001F4E0071|nr:hypothetical protein [Rosenbergiella australiborealis]
MEGIKTSGTSTWSIKESSSIGYAPQMLLASVLTVTSPNIAVNQIQHPRVSGTTEYTQSIGKEDSANNNQTKGAIMSNIGREEIEARLSRNKAEVESIASGMKSEMSDFKRTYTENFSEISKTLSRMESKADATEKRLTQAQWIISAVIALSALTISISFNIASKSHVTPSQQQPITINTAPSVSNAQPNK